MTEPRRPPHSVEAEQSLLGAVMLSDRAWDQVSAMLSEGDFFRENHRLIFRAIGALRSDGQETDAVTVADWFQRQGMLDRVDGGAYLTMLANETPGASNALGWARIVRDKARLRDLVRMGTEIADRAMSEQDPGEILADLADRSVSWSGQGTGPRNLAQISGTFLERMHALEAGDNRIETGLIDVDRRVMGLLPSELFVIAGRPGMGKTAAMQGILQHVGRQHAALCFSAEMSGEQILKRMIATEIDGRKLRDPRRMDVVDWQRINANIKQVKRDFRILIDDTGGIRIDQLEARARAAKREHGIGLIAVDYLQLLEAKSENRFQEVSLVSRRLKKLAKDLDVPVVVVSQLNRKLEDRPNKRPHLGDLRESGQLEQDADVVILLYRHRAYHQEFQSEVTEWIVAKHRDAEPGTELVLWDPTRTRFVNATDDAKAGYREELHAGKPGKGSRFQQMESA